ncbi:MAG: C1 family peptidase [Pirellulales bacterium]|nr:C1 family peptidase [Pirellulales bacterium]
MKLLATKTAAWILAMLLAAGAAMADEGGLTPKVRKGLEASLRMDPATKALRNAIVANDAKAMALNREIVEKHNNLYSHKLDVKGITNQQASGRCWLFASLNVLRPAVIKKHNLDNFEFSQSYLSFWDKLEKANCFLEDMIALADKEPFDREVDYWMKDPITDGGWWQFTVALIEKYGVVPQAVMPETLPSSNTTVMNDVLMRRLRVGAAELRRMHGEKKSLADMRKAKDKILADVYRILVMNFGQPPAEFTYRWADKDKKLSETKKYTPQSFYKEWVDVDLSQYVDLNDDPTNPYNKHYRLRRIRDIVGAPELHYVNVPGDVIKKIALKALLDDVPVLFSADARTDMDRAQGIMETNLYDYGSMYGMKLALSKRDGLITRDGAANHAMLLVGVDVREDKPVKWLVENSWGKDRGDGGYWAMYDKWFDEHVYGITIKKAYVPNKLLKLFKEPAVELPPWAPMNAPLR